MNSCLSTSWITGGRGSGPADISLFSNIGGWLQYLGWSLDWCVCCIPRTLGPAKVAKRCCWGLDQLWGECNSLTLDLISIVLKNVDYALHDLFLHESSMIATIISASASSYPPLLPPCLSSALFWKSLRNCLSLLCYSSSLDFALPEEGKFSSILIKHKPFSYSRIALPPPMHVYLVDKDMQWILPPTWSYMCERSDATFLHLIGRVSDRYWTSLPPTRGSRRRRVDISFQTISPLKYGWWCKYSYLKTCPEYLEIIVYNLISFETPIMTCIKSEKSVVR